MRKGQMILPPYITGAKSTADYGNSVCDRSKVYITTKYEAALMYAAGVRGDVYEVNPIGPIEDDPDCNEHGLSFSCDSAKIIKRLRLSDAQRAVILTALLNA